MTASEWLQAQGLSLSEIDFIETVLVNQSVFEQRGLNQTQLLALMSQHFPDKTYRIHLYLTLTDFTDLLHDNDIFIEIRTYA